jgi:UDP:flavonoid glycosyltransferase YjiC (YdhE family)
VRVVFMSAAGLGHLHPLIPLARAAAAAGDEVLFAVSAEGIPTVQGFGFPAVSIPYGDPADIHRAWAQLPERDINTYVTAEIFTRIQGRAALPAQRAAIARFRPDLVISGEVSAHVAAEAGGVASAFLGIAALDIADLDWTRVAQAADDVREAAGLRRIDTLPYEAGIRYLSPVPPLLWNNPAGLPADAIWYRHEDAEGPTVAPNRTDSARRRIYATLGSVAGANEFGRPTFHVMLDALGRLDADVLFTVGPFDRAQLGAPPANVTLSVYEPQSQAMICDAAVIHAGAGTTVAALARGLPLVAVPMFADQMHNADRLVARQLGIRVEPHNVAEQLVPAVESVLNDPTYRVNARCVADAIAARPTPAQAMDVLRSAL